MKLSASSNPNYGATPISINLTGNIGANGLNAVQNQRTLIIKNNPVGSYLNVSAPFAGNVEWSIYNSAGSRVFSTVGLTRLSTNVSTLTNGIYMVTALNRTTGENGVVKFIKK